MYGSTGANGWLTSETVSGQVTFSYRGFASAPRYDGDYDEVPTSVTCWPGGPGTIVSGGSWTDEDGIPLSNITMYPRLQGQGYHSPYCTGQFKRRDYDCSIWGCSVSGWYPLPPITRGASIRIDSVRPYEVVGRPDHPPAAGDWFNTPTTVFFQGRDDTSGIASCTSRPMSQSSVRTLQAMDGECTDRAGLTTRAVFYYHYDDVRPTVTFGDHPSTYDVDEQIVITCAASDAASGVASTTCEDVDAPAHTFGAGPHTLQATATDVATNVGEASTAFEVVATPIGLLRVSRQLAEDLRAGATRKDDEKRLAKVVEALDDALTPEAWDGPSHLATKGGKDVFKEAKNAAHDLDHVLGDKSTEVATDRLPSMIGWLVQASRLLATTAIEDAVAGDGSVKKIDDARKALAKGDDKRDDGKGENAIDRYRDAWKKALEALEGS